MTEYFLSLFRKTYLSLEDSGLSSIGGLSGSSNSSRGSGSIGSSFSSSMKN